MIFNITACGVKSNNTSKSPLRQTKDMAENVYDAIKNHDSEQLKEQFCERLQPGKETAVDKIYEYIDASKKHTDITDNNGTINNGGNTSTKKDEGNIESKVVEGTYLIEGTTSVSVKQMTDYFRQSKYSYPTDIMKKGGASAILFPKIEKN